MTALLLLLLPFARATAPDWLPGDPLLGWSDVDCTPTGRVANRVQTDWPTSWTLIGTITDTYGAPQVTGLRFELRDCNTFACTVGAPLDRRDPFVAFELVSGAADGGDRGLSTWGWDEDPTRSVGATALTVLFPFDVLLPPHGGVEVAAGPRPPGAIQALPADVASFRWEYVGVPYDDAWPWSDLLDDTERAAVHDLYTPLVTVP